MWWPATTVGLLQARRRLHWRTRLSAQRRGWPHTESAMHTDCLLLATGCALQRSRTEARAAVTVLPCTPLRGCELRCDRQDSSRPATGSSAMWLRMRICVIAAARHACGAHSRSAWQRGPTKFAAGSDGGQYWRNGHCCDAQRAVDSNRGCSCAACWPQLCFSGQCMWGRAAVHAFGGHQWRPSEWLIAGRIQLRREEQWLGSNAGRAQIRRSMAIALARL